MAEAPLPAETVSDAHWADAWLYAVLADPTISAGAKALAALLRLHLNSSSWVPSPSIDGLATRSSQTVRAVEKQRKALMEAGYIAWRPSLGRVRNDYRLIVTPNVRRELARIYPEHTAVVSTQYPEHTDGVDKCEPRTLIPATPNRKRSNPEPTAGQTRKLPKTHSGAAPRAPDGAAVAVQDPKVADFISKLKKPTKAWIWSGVVSEAPDVFAFPRKSQLSVAISDHQEDFAAKNIRAVFKEAA